MDRQHARPLIAQEEGSAASEGLRLDGKTALADLHSAYPNALFIECFFAFLEGGEGFVVDLLVGALVAEHLELLEDLHLLGFGAVADEEDLGKSKGTCTSDYIAHVVLLADVVEEQVAFGRAFWCWL